MKRNTCAACGYDDLEMFLDLGLSPIADAYTSAKNEDSSRFPLQVAVCTGCWLVQLLEVVDHTTLFGTGYSFYSSASAPLSEYHEGYAHDVLHALRREGRRLQESFIVEVGCNDGDLLRHFTDGRVLGVDPASGPVAVARDRGIDVREEAFGLKVAHEIFDDHGPADIVIANHVLAHVESVADVLAGISALLADDGTGYIEVQYLPDLLVNNAFDLVYHEHRNFFSLSSLESALSHWGLHVTDVDLTSRQGGSLRVTVKRQPATSLDSDANMIRSREGWLRSVNGYRGFQGRVERIKDRLLDHVYSHEGDLLGYGAPAKATTLLNFCGITSDDMSLVIDSTPAKQGRFIPGTGIEICAPFDLRGQDLVLVLAWNYAPEIMRNHPDYDGKWLVPIPAPVVL
jgi:novobiocin biosynthesis protein NovU/D-mycarose 3-C-methyltransferase